MNKIKNFVATWKNRGYEKGETQTFWLSFLRDVFNISEPEKYIEFEVAVKLKHKSYIDAFFPDTKVIVEQKSLSVDLLKIQMQSDGEILSAYEQAQRYGIGLPVSLHPRFIIICNFKEFLIYDMEAMTEPTKIKLTELPEKFHAFDFLIDKNKNKIRLELELSLKAGEIVGKIYNALRKNYLNPDSTESLQSLNKLCVRLVFCLYAESAGIFGKHKIFRDFLSYFPAEFLRRNLETLFEILNTPEKNRDPYLEDIFKNFPYVNGNLFADKIEIPNFTDDIKNLLLEDASATFNWSGISPTIFGAVFESTLNPATRREGGMHYTSIENIHKVIDNLFLNDLHEEFISCKKNRKKLLALQDKISQLKFFDPACGSGNFLTETYISLRKLENNILKELLGENILLGELDNPVKVSIQQFFGIELNDFACSVAQSALWIAELQMAQKTSYIIHRDLNFLPLKNFANIFEGNALRLDWHNVCPEPDFIFGNPPFVANTGRTSADNSSSIGILNDEQKTDRFNLFGKVGGVLDYVACWFKKAADFIKNTKIQCAFVSTNSICQGQQVTPLWKPLFDCGININFAYQSFKWNSESFDTAFVFVVIVGFSFVKKFPRKLFTKNEILEIPHINAYLVNAENIFIEKRSKPICDVPKMVRGSQATDNGNLILSEFECDQLLKNYPQAIKFIRPFMMGKDFIYRKPRYCLWLVNVSPSEIKKIPPIFERVKKVRDFRLTSKKAATREKANFPTLFDEILECSTNYIALPKVSSGNRKYIPIDYLSPDIIAGDKIFVVQNASLFHLGILTSSLHMLWQNLVCSKYGSSYSYSNTLAYNNFIWCEPTENLRKKIEQTAQLILDCRNNYPDTSLADLYDPTLMPKDLRDAHKKKCCPGFGGLWFRQKSFRIADSRTTF